MARKRKLPKTLAEYKAMTETEDDVQAAIVQFLQLHGMEVKQTNLAKSRVLADEGVPDLIVTSIRWPRSCWLGLEVKKAKGRPSPEQARLAAAEHIVIVRSVDDAREAVKDLTREIHCWKDASREGRPMLPRGGS